MCQAVDRLSICSDNNLICKYVRNIRIDISVRWKCLPISLYKCAHADRTQQEKWKTFFAARRWFVVALAWLLIYQNDMVVTMGIRWWQCAHASRLRWCTLLKPLKWEQHSCRGVFMYSMLGMRCIDAIAHIVYVAQIVCMKRRGWVRVFPQQSSSRFIEQRRSVTFSVFRTYKCSNRLINMFHAVYYAKQRGGRDAMMQMVYYRSRRTASAYFRSPHWNGNCFRLTSAAEIVKQIQWSIDSKTL